MLKVEIKQIAFNTNCVHPSKENVAILTDCTSKFHLNYLLSIRKWLQLQESPQLLGIACQALATPVSTLLYLLAFYLLGRAFLIDPLFFVKLALYKFAAFLMSATVCDVSLDASGVALLRRTHL